MATKKIISLGLLLMGLMSFQAFGANVSMQQLYTDTRFQPVDSFHAGCDQDAQFTLDAKEKNITEVHLVVNYNPSDIEVLRVLGADNVVADYKMEYSSMVFDISNLDKTAQSIPLFHLAFQGNETLASSAIEIATGSYYVTNGKKVSLTQVIPMTFTAVPECTPDVIPPSIKLIYPENPKERITLDQYFIFEIKDIGKGIDQKSVKVMLDGQLFSADTENMKWNGNYLTFYPKDRLAIDTGISLAVTVNDQQVYGGPNTTEKEFTFKTAIGLVLQNNIDPMTFRAIAKGAKAILGTAEECILLKNVYAGSDAFAQQGLMGILSKLNCDTTDIGTYTITPATDTTHGAALDKGSTKIAYFSVFAIIGWLLFLIALPLKLHYFMSYKKHKRLADMYKNQ